MARRLGVGVELVLVRQRGWLLVGSLLLDIEVLPQFPNIPFPPDASACKVVIFYCLYSVSASGVSRQ